MMAKKRKLKVVWSCSDFVKHEHRTYIGALLCGWWQQVMERKGKIMSDVYRELYLDKQNQLLDLLKKACALQEELDGLKEFHPRAFKLMQKQKIFIVIADDEPYYFEAYSLIREHEIQKGTWSEEDERIFRVQWAGSKPGAPIPTDIASEKGAYWICDDCHCINPIRAEKCDCGDTRPSCIHFFWSDPNENR